MRADIDENKAEYREKSITAYWFISLSRIKEISTHSQGLDCIIFRERKINTVL